MGINIYDPSKALGDKITELDRKSLCELCSALCAQLKARAGFDGYCGGIYPSNISVGDDGNVAIGEGRRKDFSTEEVKFTAPELFWKGESSAAADVYSLGMLLYFACSGGKMPFDEDSADAATAQQRRMNGERFRAPKAAGRRLGEIIEKATSFRVEDRYKNPDEMKAMVDSCVKNLYLNGEPNAETIFNKSDDDLSDIEKMMIAIIENNGEPEQPPSDETPAVETPAEEVPAAEEAPAEAEEAAEEPAEQAEEPAEEILPEEPQAEPESPVEEPEIAAEEINSETVPTGAPAEAILPEETAQPEEEAPAAPQREPVPQLVEDKNPELEPVVIYRRAEQQEKSAPKAADKRQPVKTPAVQYGVNVERERKIAEKIRRRKRRPVIVILTLCALLVVAALIVNAMQKDRTPSPTPSPAAPSAAPVETAPVQPEQSAEPEVTPEPEQPKESTYQVFVEDISWTDARAKCEALGGHLVVISDEAEFAKVVELARNSGANKFWIGCHRVDGTLVWETTEEVSYYPWASGEPSYFDSYDGVSENYVMLWYADGWVYNDSRNDPVADYPGAYSGTIGYICEFEG